VYVFMSFDLYVGRWAIPFSHLSNHLSCGGGIEKEENKDVPCLPWKNESFHTDKESIEGGSREAGCLARFSIPHMGSTSSRCRRLRGSRPTHGPTQTHAAAVLSTEATNRPRTTFCASIRMFEGPFPMAPCALVLLLSLGWPPLGPVVFGFGCRLSVRPS